MASPKAALILMADPTPEKVLFRCHACRQKYAVLPTRIGSRTKCMKCQAVMQVPKENALDRPEASKPTVHVTPATAKVTGPHQSVAELSFDDTDSKAGESLVVEQPDASADAPRPPAGGTAKVDLFDPALAPVSDSGIGSGVKSGLVDAAPPKAPPGKKLCPSCQHACPTMALSCPLCQHRFELPKPKPKPTARIPEQAAAVAEDSAIHSGSWNKSGISSADVAAPKKEETAKPKKDLEKKLDQFITERKKIEGRPVEPPMWMDEAVYGSAFKLSFAGLCCLAAGAIIFVQLDSPQSARNAFFLIRWFYNVGGPLGRWIPSLLCLTGGIAFLYFAIKPVIAHLRREKAIHLADEADHAPRTSK